MNVDRQIIWWEMFDFVMKFLTLSLNHFWDLLWNSGDDIRDYHGFKMT